MRVLHVDTASSWRGGQNQVLLTAQGMAARGHSVAVACRSGGALEERLPRTGVDVHPVAFRGDLSPLAALSLARVMRAFRPDVAHLHDPHAISAGLMAARLQRGAWLVATRRVDFALRSAMSRRKYVNCDRVIAVSRAIAAVLERDGVPSDHLRVVYEGVPSRPARRGGREALQALGVPDGAPVVGNVAALTDHKDHATLLEAAPRILARVPDVRFVIVGEGELRPVLEARAAALGLGDRWILAGFRDDVDALLPAFTVFCLSSHSEGLGTSLLDAMNFGRPIVATSAGGIPEAVEDGRTGRVVPARDPEALADALVELLCEESLRESMGRAGRSRFEEHFTADRMVDATLHLYEERR
jgi:glycosyltransferase involved in cell wall biosynthesis